jgi:hypothetical protein
VADTVIEAAASMFGKVVQGAVIGACSALGTALLGPLGTIGGMAVGKMLIGAAIGADPAGTEVSVASADAVSSEPSEFVDSLLG